MLFMTSECGCFCVLLRILAGLSSFCKILAELLLCTHAYDAILNGWDIYVKFEWVSRYWLKLGAFVLLVVLPFCI